MKRKRILIMTVVVLVVGLLSLGLLSACGEEEAETTTSAAAAETTTTAAGAETTAAPSSETTVAAGGFEGEIVIGGLCSLTGVSAMTGAEQKWAQEKAVADINAAGGVDVGGKKMELKLTLIDDKSDATEAAAAMEKLIKVENLNLILGTQVESAQHGGSPGSREVSGLLPHDHHLYELGPREEVPVVHPTCSSNRPPWVRCHS